MYKLYFSKRYTIFLIFILIFVFNQAIHAQERVGYRVEVIILRLVGSSFPPEPVEEPRDFSDAPDLVDRELKRQEWITAMAAMTMAGAAEVDLLPPLNPVASQFTATEFTATEQISYIEEPSERMSGVWRNLRLSAEYRPEVFLSWEQPAEGDFPPLRMHNQEVLLVDDPNASQRVSLAPAEPDTEQAVQQIFHYDFEAGTLSLQRIPEPRYYYSVDGEVRMRRSRFLHIDLDLTYRHPAPSTLQGMSGPPLLPEHQGYQTYKLVQTRQIRTGRMEYFDSPVLGVLVWVTAIEKNEDEAVQ